MSQIDDLPVEPTRSASELPDSGSSTHSEPSTSAWLDVGALRHPTEGSRFALALVASSLAVSVGVFVLVSLGQGGELALFLLLLAGLLFAVWLTLQLWRLRLLGDGVLVSPEALPEVQAAVDTVRQRLGYYGRVPVFVVDKISRVLAAESAPITLTSYFGVNVIVAEGDALGDLSNERDHQQLVFRLATHFGALKARHTRWSPFLVALQFTFLPKFVFPFVYPWMRATVYTGDRIAYACCGDLGVSLEAVYRVLVGNGVAPYLRATGLVSQALVVRRRIIPRLSQLLRPMPHVTNRFLDLLSFVAGHERSAFDTFRATLDPSVNEVDAVLARLQRRRPLALATPASALLSVLFLVGSVVLGLKAQNSDVASVISSMFAADATTTPVSPTEGPSPVPTGTPTVDPRASRDVTSQAQVTAPRSAPDGFDAGGNRVSYGAANLVDGDASTAWRTRGDGTGMKITFSFPQPVTFTSVGLVNGYAKIDSYAATDRYAQERRIVAVTWIFDGRELTQQLEDGNRAIQGGSFPAITASTVTLRIDETTPPGDQHFDYTAIGEVYLLGQ